MKQSKILSYRISNNTHIIETDAGVFSYLPPFDITERIGHIRSSNCLICHTSLSPKSDICRECKTTDSGKVYLKIRRKVSFLSSIGVESNYARSDVKEKRMAGWIERTGFANPSLNPETIRKSKATSRTRYGADHAMQTEKFKTKLKQSLIEKYGVDSPIKNPDSQKKMRKTMEDRLGVSHALQSKDVQLSLEKRSEELYGTRRPQQAESCRIKIRKSKDLSTYGMERDEFREDFRRVFLSEGLISALDAFPGISRQIALRHFLTDDEKRTSSSIIESDVKRELSRLSGIQFEGPTRGLIPSNSRLEIDMHNQSEKISIEFDGIYYHQNSYEKELSKALEMRSIGWRHLRLTELDLDNLDLIGDMISNKTKLFARTLHLSEISNSEAKEFFNDNHLQGHVNAKTTLALKLSNEIVMAMSFGKPRFDKDSEWELIRLATKRGLSVTGGSERLFSKFIKKYSPSAIVSYSDNRFFNGSVYSRLGFEFIELTTPSYVWVKGDKRLSRYMTQRHKLSSMFSEDFDDNMTENEIMTQKGWMKVYDLGHKKWIWKSSNSIT